MIPLPGFLPGRLSIRTGNRVDYRTLAPFHYLPKRPATFAAIVAIDYFAERLCCCCQRERVEPAKRGVDGELRPPSPLYSGERDRGRGALQETQAVCDRMGVASRPSPQPSPRVQGEGGCNLMRIGDSPQSVGRTIAVGVLSWPVPACGARDRRFGLLGRSRREKIIWANQNLRTISRVIVHPQFRSLGLSTILVDWLCEHCDTRYVESMARMGNAHPFFERAGFTRIEPDDPDGPVYFLKERKAAARRAA